MATVAVDSLGSISDLQFNMRIQFQSEANQLCHIARDKRQSCHAVDSGVAAFVEGVKEGGVVAKEGRERQGGREGRDCR